MLRLKQDLEPGRAIFGELVEPCGADPVVRENAGNELGNQSRAGAPAPHKQRIDEVVVTYFAKPHSYTTDDVVEISAHGSPVVLRHIVELAIAGGPRSDRITDIISGQSRGTATRRRALATAATDQAKTGGTHLSARGWNPAS